MKMQVGASRRKNIPVSFGGEYFPIFCPREFKRSRTPECEKNALSVIADYLEWDTITHEEHDYLEREIISAPHDDAISDIMTHLRHRIYN
jgi:hypothetical protein